MTILMKYFKATLFLMIGTTVVKATDSFNPADFPDPQDYFKGQNPSPVPPIDPEKAPKPVLTTRTTLLPLLF